MFGVNKKNRSIKVLLWNIKKVNSAAHSGSLSSPPSPSSAASSHSRSLHSQFIGRDPCWNESIKLGIQEIFPWIGVTLGDLTQIVNLLIWTLSVRFCSKFLVVWITVESTGLDIDNLLSPSVFPAVSPSLCGWEEELRIRFSWRLSLYRLQLVMRIQFYIPWPVWAGERREERGASNRCVLQEAGRRRREC